MNCKILTSALPNIPWEERPAGSSELMWRYSGNPVIRPDGIRNANSIFNSAVVPFGDAYAGVFRVDDTCRIQRLHAGFSADGRLPIPRRGFRGLRGIDGRASRSVCNAARELFLRRRAAEKA